MSVIMGKEASLDGLEFDGDTVLCRVCGDKASGFHYGVHACEGCKGFFRRSIQQKIQYRPCLKNQQCNIMRVNRNRCQYCRLKKCIAVGMSRDAVRFGRVPKKEKARIIEQMQKSNLQIAATALSSALSTQDMVQSVIVAHHQTSEYGPEKAKVMREIALLQNDFVDCPAHMACPLNSYAGSDNTDNQDWTDFSEFFAPAIKSVVDFAKLIPGFLLFNQDDQVTLLKAATFEVLLIRMACLFDTESSTMMFAHGKLFKRQTTGLSTSVGFLLDSMFDFAERFNKLNLNDDELALFCAVVLLSPDRPGLRQVDQVERVQSKLTESLQNMINTNHKEDNTLFAKLLMKTTDLRTLNALHSEKTVGSSDRNEDGIVEMQDSQSDNRSEDVTPSGSMSSINTITSSSTMDTASSLYDSNGSSIHQQSRFSGESPHQQQVVLKTPYGTFYREDTGYYGMMPDQPRRRCHTLDRDSQISRPRLHTIEEGSRRRYTMDREYITKMVGKLSDRLEKRTHVNSMPGSVNSSACSSPVPILEEQYTFMNRNRDFIPISTPDSSACSSRTSPSFHKDTLQPFASSPNSPRPRSDSIGTDDFGPMQRPRCASFHVNSEGHAAQGRSYIDGDYLTADGQQYRMSAEMRRGSVGASYNLHARKKSLLVDRHPAYLSQNLTPESVFRKSEKQRSPLALEDSTKRCHIGSGSSAFEQVTHLNMPTSWGGNIAARQNKPDPPKVSVTIEDFSTQQHDGDKFNVDSNRVISPNNSLRNSPEMEGKKPDEVYHKKFDKIRKHPLGTSEETKQMENLTIHDVEQMESDDICTNDSVSKSETENGIKSEKKSACDSHPQLLAQLNSGPQFPRKIHPAFQPAAGPQLYNLHHIQQQQQNAGNLNGNMDTMKSHGSTSPNSVVLSVPKAPFMNHNSLNSSPPSTMTSSSRSDTQCLQNILNRRDNSALSNNVDKNHTQELSQQEIQHYRNSQTSQQMQPMYPGFTGHAGQQQPVMMQNPYMLYQQLLMQQQGMRAPQYNEHLAGMQQMVYGGNAQQLRRCSGGDIPLNLVQPNGLAQSNTQSSDTSDTSSSELIQNIKEEVIS